MNPVNVIRMLCRRLRAALSSPTDYARSIGVKIGDNCLIDTRNWSSEPYLIEIGNNCQITKNVWFHTHGGAHAVRRIDPTFDLFGKIKVEDYAYVGANSQIMPGVTIGEGALISAGSIVTKSVPPGQVWGGVPARFICTVEEYNQRNKKYNLATKGLSSERKRQLLMNTPDDRFIKK